MDEPHPKTELEKLESHLRWMSHQTMVGGIDLQEGVQGALRLLAAVKSYAPRPVREERKPPGVYRHRAEADDPWDLAMITRAGTILFIGTDSQYRGEDAVHYMSSGEWVRLPDNPASDDEQHG